MQYANEQEKRIALMVSHCQLGVFPVGRTALAHGYELIE